MTPTIYVGDHQHAKVICSAFAEGCGGKLVPATSPITEDTELAVMWGILRGAGDRIKECELYGVPYLYIDHGYFRRGHYDGYYRVVYCDRHLQGPPRESSGGRWGALDLKIEPYRALPPPGERRAVYLPVSRHVADYMGFDPDEFDAVHLGRLAVGCGFHPDNVDVHAKGDTGIEFDGSEFVAGFQSNAMLEAALAGCETYDLGSSPADYLAMGRDKVFRWLADNQWTLEEMRNGKCWSDMMERHGDSLRSMAA